MDTRSASRPLQRGGWLITLQFVFVMSGCAEVVVANPDGLLWDCVGISCTYETMHVPALVFGTDGVNGRTETRRLPCSRTRRPSRWSWTRVPTV